MATRVWIHFHPQPANNRYEFRLSQPPPYQGAPYFSRDFINESFQAPGGWITPPNAHYVVPGNFHGRWFNIERNQRLTTGQPHRFERRLLLFGGSAIFCAEVPDDATVASALQRLLNQHRPGVWRVENWGSSSVNTKGQLERLRSMPLRPGDLVVFYDGVNDVIQGLTNGDPEGWIVGANRQKIVGAGPVKSLLIQWNAKYLATQAQHYSWFLRYPVGNLVNGAGCRTNPVLSDPDRVAALARETARVFLGNLEAAEQYARSQKAGFAHFLQPNIFTRDRRTLYEQSLVDDCYINPMGLETAFRAGYPLLRGKGSDLSSVLDQRAPGEEFYLDYCHVNHVANERIAAAIFRVLEQ